jgi:hypothetical protein
MRSIISIFALSLVFVGCDSKKEWPTRVRVAEVQKVQSDYEAALEDANRSIPCAVEFARLFPGAKSGFSYYIGGAGPTSFYMEADLYGKYELTMPGLPVTFDASRRKVISFGEPEFILRELTELRKIRKVGIDAAFTNWSGSYNMEGQRRLGASEWKRIVAARGDFSVIGFTFVTNRPLPGFREYRDSTIRDSLMNH